VILSHVDDNTTKKLGVRLTCEPVYRTAKSPLDKASSGVVQ